MQNRSTVKIILVIVLIILIVGAIVFAMKSQPANSNFVPPASPSGAGMDDLNASSTGNTNLNKISASSSVSSDMSAYLKASSETPSPNDFNDSYSDINQ
jgi:hypothetical protein